MMTTSAIVSPGRYHRSDWSSLVGEPVEIWREGRRVRTGLIEQATSDDSVLWIAAEGALPREMFDKYAGCEVWTLQK
ncbi:hypothetical protein GA0061083_0061 [Pseudarthrobacter enclensis]|nr:hypothetical protein GA0061083_0061 [Pseudarthrobacter enclensis]